MSRSRRFETFQTADWVYTMCAHCDGYVYAGADMAGNVRDIQKELLVANREHRKSMRVRAGGVHPHPCRCPRRTVTTASGTETVTYTQSSGTR